MIKIRVFDKRYNTYLSQFQIGNMLWEALNSKDYILELSTNQFDANGKEIYDGDILEDTYDNYIWVVSYSEVNAMFKISDDYITDTFGYIDSKGFKIIGNKNQGVRK